MLARFRQLNLARRRFTHQIAPHDDFLQWTQREHFFAPKVQLATNAQGRRGLFALDHIPRASVICAVPETKVFALSNFPAFSLGEHIGESLPTHMTDLRERLRLAVLLLMESLNSNSDFQPWLSILPTEPIKNVALLTEQDIKTMLHAQLPGKHGSERIQRLITATNALQSRVDYVIHEEGATSGILEGLSESYNTPLADVQRKLKWALSIVYSRSMLLPVLVDEPKEATEGHSHKAKKAREAVDTFRRQAESTEQQHHAHHPHGNHKHKIRSPLFGATREERGAESEVSELSIVPLLDLVNHADEGAGQVSNAAFSFTTMDNLASGEKMVLKTSLQKSGIDDQQFEHLGPRLLLLQATDEIGRGEEIALKYLEDMHGMHSHGPDAADFLWHYGFVPPRSD